jgi:hypothetical protein
MRMSATLIAPLLVLYTNVLHWVGWNSAAVMTSVNSSMFAGFMSTISVAYANISTSVPFQQRSLSPSIQQLARWGACLR